MANDTDIFGELPKVAAPTDSDIFKDLPQKAEASQKAPEKTLTQRVVGDDPLRDVALGFRGLASGAMTLPLMGADALNRLLRLGGVPIPDASVAFDATLNRLGAPQARSPSEKVAYEMNRGAAAGLAFPPLLQGPLVPALQGVSGGISGTAGQIAENAGMGPVASPVIGAMAGMAVPSSPDVLGVLGRGTRAASQPFTAGGREELVGNALVRMATQPKQALLNIAGAPVDDVSRLTTAQAAKDPGLLSTERGLANLPGSGGRITNHYAEQNAARLALLNSMAKTPEELAALKASRSAEAERLYEPAFNSGPIKPTEELIAISKRPAFEQAAKKAMEIAGNEGLDLGSPLNTMRGLHYLKKGVDDLVENAKPGSNEMRALVKMKNDLLGVMDDISPAYKTARESFAQASKPINQMELLQELKQRSMTSNITTQGDRVLSQAKWTNAVTDNLPDLKKQLSAEQVGNLQRIARDLDYGRLSESGGKVAGSNTFQNLSVANVLGAALGKETAESPAAQSLLRPLGFLFKLPERQVEELMVEAMLDPKLAVRLMSKADQMNVASLATGLKARLGASTRGAVAGQAQ